MAYGTIKVDTITFTDGGIDKSVAISGLVQNPTFTGNVTVTGTVSGNTVQGQTISGVTVTGTTANFTSGNFTNISGGTHTITSGVFALGTAANPSISFTSDPNTGIYSPGADQVAISTNGTGRLFVDASGNVSIGTSTVSDFGGYQTLGINDTVGGFLEFRSSNTLSHGIVGDSNFLFVKSIANLPLLLGTNDTERLRITPDGKLGLGTSSVGAQLDVYNSQASGISEVARLRWNNGGTGGALTFANQSGTVLGQVANVTSGSGVELAFSTYNNSTALGERMRLTSTGLGIGTTSPSTLLTLAGSNDGSTNNNTLRFVDTDPSSSGTQESGRIEFFTSDSTQSGVHSYIAGQTTDVSGNGAITFGTGLAGSATERLRIDSSGRLLVGTSSSVTGSAGAFYPSYATLQVLGNSQNAAGSGALVLGRKQNTADITGADTFIGLINFTDAQSGYYADISTFTDAAPGAGSYPGRLVFSTTANGSSSPTERLRIDSSGRVGIGTASPAGKLEVSTGNAEGLRLSSPSYLSASQGPWIAFNGGPFSGWDVARIQGIRLGSNAEGGLVFSTNNGGGGAGTISEKARIDNSGRLLIGTSTARSNFYYSTIARTPGLQYESTGSNTSLSVLRTDGLAALFLANAGTVIADDSIGGLNFVGNDGTNLRSFAKIEAAADGAVSAGDVPGRLVFFTTADGANNPTERMRIDSTGFVSFAGDTDTGISVPSSNKLQFTVGGVSPFAINSDYSFVAAHSSILQSVGFISHTSTSFAAAVLKINCNRTANSAYSFLQAYSGSYADTEFLLRGDGNGLCDGSWTGGGADYAEYFEWSDANPNAEDRRGISVVLDGDKIRPAVAGEDPIGVISGNPSVVGDSAWNKWSGKYLRDEFGTYIQEDYEIEDEDGNTVIQQRRKLNPAYDPDVEYISREERPEWDCVGLMGKLRVRKGQPTGSRWIKMRDISATVEEWLVR